MKLPSGRFVLRLDPRVHLRLKLEAEAQNQSLNRWIEKLLVENSRINFNGHGEVVDAIRDCFQNDLLGIILFGSFVRAEMKENSDIDLLIVINEGRPVERSLYREWDQKIEKVDGPMYTPQFSHLASATNASGLWLEVAMEGKILFDTGNIIESRLREIRNEISANRYQRKISHGHPYWVRNSKDAK